MPGDLITAEEFSQAARSALLAGSSPLSEDVVDLETSNAGLVRSAIATMGVQLSRQVQQGLQGLYLGSARGTALDLLVRDRYGIERLGASPGVGEVRISRPTATYGAIAVPAGTQISAGAVTIETTEDVAFGAVDLGPYTMDVQTTKGGSNQAVAAGTPLQVQGLDDTSIVAELVDDLVGADDEESDAELAQRAREFWVNARRGTVGAVLNGLLATGGVYRATVQEVLDAEGHQLGYVEAWISDRAGRSNSALAALAGQTLEEYRPCGCRVVIGTSSPTYVEITIFGISFAAGTDTSAKRDAIKVAVMAEVNNLRPGETLRLARLYYVLSTIAGVTVPAGSISEPIGDLEADSDESIRTRLDLITVNGS